MMRSNPSRKYGKLRSLKTPHATVGTNHSSTFKTNGSVAGTTAKSIATTDQPDLHISPESTDEEKRSAWNQIKTRSTELSQFLNLLMTEFGRPRNVSVRWSNP